METTGGRREGESKPGGGRKGDKESEGVGL